MHISDVHAYLALFGSEWARPGEGGEFKEFRIGLGGCMGLGFKKENLGEITSSSILRRRVGPRVGRGDRRP